MTTKDLAAVRNTLVADALKYARMKLFGAMLGRDGVLESCHRSEQAELADIFLRGLGQQAEYLLKCMTACDDVVEKVKEKT